MGVKKIARPVNKAKNLFVEWLKDNKADDIDVFKGELPFGFDYYINVSAFIQGTFYSVYFMIFNGSVRIDYTGGTYIYDNLSINEFMELIN